MHARLTSVSISPDRIAEGNRIYQESVGPAVANLKGFRGAFLLSDPNTGESISMTLWETEADGPFRLTSTTVVTPRNSRF